MIFGIQSLFREKCFFWGENIGIYVLKLQYFVKKRNFPGSLYCRGTQITYFIKCFETTRQFPYLYLLIVANNPFFFSLITTLQISHTFPDHIALFDFTYGLKQ